MAALAEEHFSSLQMLLKAPSKDVVRQICKDSFPSPAHESQRLVDAAARTLSVSSAEAVQVLTAFHLLSRHVVFYNLSAPEQIQSVFPATFHSNLKNLITKILLEQSATWRNEALSSQISLPRLADLDWRVDMKLASDSVSRMAVPTCILNLKIRDGGDVSSSGGSGGGTSDSSVTVELSKETLDTMLDGLGRIRDQLSAVAGK